jgi:hypothetical protein
MIERRPRRPLQNHFVVNEMIGWQQYHVSVRLKPQDLQQLQQYANAVPRFAGCTTMLQGRTGRCDVSHHSRCWSATIRLMRSGVHNFAARRNVSCSSVGPPRNEQYCFGTGEPRRSVVSERRRLPSPAASTNAQV